MAAIAFAQQQPAALQLLQHAVHRRFGQAGQLHQVLQCVAPVLARHDFQQRKQAHGGRVAAQARALGDGGLDLGHKEVLVNGNFHQILYQ